MHTYMCVYIYIYLKMEEKIWKTTTFLIQSGKLSSLTGISNTRLFQYWAVNWYSNSFQDTQFCSMRYIKACRNEGCQQEMRISRKAVAEESWQPADSQLQRMWNPCPPKSFGFPAANLLCSTQLIADTVIKLLKN